jgi:hypothetical protein
MGKWEGCFDPEGPEFASCLMQEPVIMGMSADEKPDNDIFVHDSKGTKIIRYPSRPISAHFFEANRRMMRIEQPKPILFQSQPLNVRGQEIVTGPKTGDRPTFHRAEKPHSALPDIHPKLLEQWYRVDRPLRLPRFAYPMCHRTVRGTSGEDEESLHGAVVR